MAESKQKPRMSFINIIPSPVVTQALASAGADAVVIDQEHAPVGPESLHAMIASTAGTKCLPFVRVTTEEAADCVAMTKCPSHGRRGFGPFIAHSRWAVPFEEYFSRIGDTARCNLLIETRAAIQSIEAICAVPGISALIIAGLDLSVNLGCPGRFDDPEFVEAVERFEKATSAAGVPKGTLALTEEQARAAVARGYSAVGLGFDILMLKSAAMAATGWLDDDSTN